MLRDNRKTILKEFGNCIESSNNYTPQANLIRKSAEIYYSGSYTEKPTGKFLYLTPNKEYAKEYGEYITAYECTPQNPVDLSPYGERELSYLTFAKIMKDLGLDISKLVEEEYKDGRREPIWFWLRRYQTIPALLKSEGYDSIKLKESKGGAIQDSILVLDKSIVRETITANLKRYSQKIAPELKPLEEAAKESETFEQFQEKVKDLLLYHGGADFGEDEYLRPGHYGKKGSGSYAGALFVTPSKTYATGYVKPDGKMYHTVVNPENYFDIKKPKHIKRLKEGVKKNYETLDYEKPQDALNDLNYRLQEMKSQQTQSGYPDWATASDLLEALQLSGFDGAIFQERAAENLELAEEGGYTLSGDPVISYAILKEEYPVISDLKKFYESVKAGTLSTKSTMKRQFAKGLKEGDRTNLGKIEEVYADQYRIKDKWYKDILIEKVQDFELDKETLLQNKIPSSVPDYLIEDTINKIIEMELPLNEDGSITLYHGTTPQNAKKIEKTGFNKWSYFSTSPTVASNFGSKIIEFRANPTVFSNEGSSIAVSDKALTLRNWDRLIGRGGFYVPDQEELQTKSSMRRQAAPPAEAWPGSPHENDVTIEEIKKGSLARKSQYYLFTEEEIRERAKKSKEEQDWKSNITDKLIADGWKLKEEHNSGSSYFNNTVNGKYYMLRLSDHLAGAIVNLGNSIYVNYSYTPYKEKHWSVIHFPPTRNIDELAAEINRLIYRQESGLNRNAKLINIDDTIAEVYQEFIEEADKNGIKHTLDEVASIVLERYWDILENTTTNIISQSNLKIKASTDAEYLEAVESGDMEKAGISPKRKAIKSNKTDEAYLDAIALGDMETAQQLVEQEARTSGYDFGPVYHGTKAEFTIFDIEKAQQTDAGWLGKGFYFYEDVHEARGYGKAKPYFLKIENMYMATDEENDLLAELNDPEESEKFSGALQAEGYDGVYYNGDLRGETVVFEPNQIKSAETIVYDEKGDVIPLSKRFNLANMDVRAMKTQSIKVYRGERESGEKRFKGTHYSTNIEFAKKFGDVKEYELAEKNILDITDISIIDALFGKEIAQSFESGDFWKLQPDTEGFNYRPIDRVISYAKQNLYNAIKYKENYSSTEQIENYLVLNDNIINQMKTKSAYIGWKGKNGNTLVDYKWLWTWGEKWSDYEGGMVSAKVTDKDATPEHCSTCGRAIWHIYYVKDAQTGEIKPYGKEHVHEALGYPRPLKASELDKMVYQLQYEQKQKEAQVKHDEERRQKAIIKAGQYNKSDQMQQANIIYKEIFGYQAIKGSYFAENPAGDLVRVNGNKPDDVEYYKNLGFTQTSETVTD